MGKHVVGNTIYDAYYTKRDGEPFEEMFLKNKFLFAGAVNPIRLNERLAVQQGVFLCPGDIKHSFEENLRSREKLSTLREKIHKIFISRQCRSEVLARLRGMNIDRTSLFGGLDGFAQSLNTRFKEIGELNVIEEYEWPKEPAR